MLAGDRFLLSAWPARFVGGPGMPKGSLLWHSLCAPPPHTHTHTHTCSCEAGLARLSSVRQLSTATACPDVGPLPHLITQVWDPTSQPTPLPVSSGSLLANMCAVVPVSGSLLAPLTSVADRPGLGENAAWQPPHPHPTFPPSLEALLHPSSCGGFSPSCSCESGP